MFSRLHMKTITDLFALIKTTLLISYVRVVGIRLLPFPSATVLLFPFRNGFETIPAALRVVPRLVSMSKKKKLKEKKRKENTRCGGCVFSQAVK